MSYMYEKDARITYYDLDLTGRMKLSALLRLVHIAADINANDLGIGFTTLTELNMSFVLQRFALGLTRMPEYDETVKLRTWPDSVARGTFLRKGDIHDIHGNKIMEWTSMWILFDITARKILKPSALPVELTGMEDHGVKIMPEKITFPKPGEHPGELFSEYTHTVRYAEIDTNRHMNNSIYGDLIGNALFPTPHIADTARPWREVQINYLAEARPGEEINVRAYRETDKFIVTGEADGRISFAARVC